VQRVRTSSQHFGFAIPEFDLSSSELWQLVDGAGDYAATVKHFRALGDRGLLNVVLDRLDDLKQKVPLDVAQGFVRAIFTIGDEVAESDGFMLLDASTHTWRIVYWYLLQEQDADQRSQMFIDAFRGTDALSVPASLISLDEDEREKSTAHRRLLTDTALEEARQLWLERMAEAHDKPQQLLEHRHLGHLLYRWREWGGEEIVRAWISSAIETERGPFCLLVAFANKVRTHSAGDAVARKMWRVNLAEFEKFLDPNKLAERLASLTNHEVAPDERGALSAFTKALAKYRAGLPSEDLFDCD
jgi:hypothetical protein